MSAVHPDSDPDPQPNTYPDPDPEPNTEPEPNPEPNAELKPEPDRCPVTDGHRHAVPIRGEPMISVWALAETGALAAAPPAGLVALVLVTRSHARWRGRSRSHSRRPQSRQQEIRQPEFFLAAPVAELIAEPVAAPMTAPMTAPVVTPVAAPMAAPMAAPRVTPMAAPVVTPLAAPPLAAGRQAAGVRAKSTGQAVVRRLRPADDSVAVDRLFASAERFITLFHNENHAGPPDQRLWHVRREIETTGTYWHTPAELEFGARAAWRNSSRCIGRLYWHNLRVRDRRHITTAPAITAEAVTHLREATNDGRIRPTITVFAPDTPGRPGPRILNPQLIRYAGYPAPGGADGDTAGGAADGTVTGDPSNVAITRFASDLGWAGRRPPGRFDVLPLLIQDGPRLSLHELPADAVLEVIIRHPEFGWFADLGLRWHAVPVISDMYLDIGGVRYPAAPFNGWYMCTEIGSRNLGDTDRYDQLPAIARHMGLSTATDRTLWKDKAMTELNLAVLHSFAAARVTLSDHHTESARFLRHMEREQRQGRACPADWSWIVPPAASSTTPVFHRYYQDFDQTPNFYRHPAPAWLKSEDVTHDAQPPHGTHPDAAAVRSIRAFKGPGLGRSSTPSGMSSDYPNQDLMY